MVTKGLFVRLEAKEGKANEIESFLASAVSLVKLEPATKAWFANRVGLTHYSIIDMFDDEAGRDAHLNGEVAKGLMQVAPESAYCRAIPTGSKSWRRVPLEGLAFLTSAISLMGPSAASAAKKSRAAGASRIADRNSPSGRATLAAAISTRFFVTILSRIVGISLIENG